LISWKDTKIFKLIYSPFANIGLITIYKDNFAGSESKL